MYIHVQCISHRYAGVGAFVVSGLVTVILAVLPREPKVSTDEQTAVVSFTRYL